VAAKESQTEVCATNSPSQLVQNIFPRLLWKTLWTSPHKTDEVLK
jgi:hypothetical protein